MLAPLGLGLPNEVQAVLVTHQGVLHPIFGDPAPQLLNLAESLGKRAESNNWHVLAETPGAKSNLKVGKYKEHERGFRNLLRMPWVQKGARVEPIFGKVEDRLPQLEPGLDKERFRRMLKPGAAPYEQWHRLAMQTIGPNGDVTWQPTMPFDWAPRLLRNGHPCRWFQAGGLPDRRSALTHLDMLHLGWRSEEGASDAMEHLVLAGKARQIISCWRVSTVAALAA